MKNFSIPEIFGVVNITADSFSDGGKYLDPQKAIEHAEKLLADGADILDLGAASSNPQAIHVPIEVEIERLAPVVAYLKEKGARISIDTTKREVQEWALAQGVEFLNDIRGFPDESFYPTLAASKAKLIVMHCIRLKVGQVSDLSRRGDAKADLEKAVRAPKTPEEVFHSIRTFFHERLKRLLAAGIAQERIIIDPGLGFFLASNPEPSLAVLAHLAALKKEFGFPLLIGVSRKSFLRNLGEPERCDIQARTLAAEIFAAMQGADYIRTHDAAALYQSLFTIGAIERVYNKAYE